jgi:DNA-directed RNA polymerase specialized sigma24 family protein
MRLRLFPARSPLRSRRVPLPRSTETSPWEGALPGLADLPAIERQILAMNLLGGLHPSRIGAELGVSQSYVNEVLDRPGP